jgi:hypothetical protein
MGPAGGTFADAERALLQLATLLENTNAMCIASRVPFRFACKFFVSGCVRALTNICTDTNWAHAQLWA